MRGRLRSRVPLWTQRPKSSVAPCAIIVLAGLIKYSFSQVYSGIAQRVEIVYAASLPFQATHGGQFHRNRIHLQTFLEGRSRAQKILEFQVRVLLTLSQLLRDQRNQSCQSSLPFVHKPEVCLKMKPRHEADVCANPQCACHTHVEHIDM
jgi:hypothetical protein